MPLGNFRGFSMHMALYEDNYQSINYSGDPYSRDYIDNYFPNGFMYSEFPVVMLEPESNQWPLDGVQPRELGIMPRFKSNWDKKNINRVEGHLQIENRIFIPLMLEGYRVTL